MENRNTTEEKKESIRSFHNTTGYSLADIWRGVAALGLRLERVKGFQVLNTEQAEKLKNFLDGSTKEHTIYESKMNKQND